MTATSLTLSALEAQFTASYVAQVFCDDGSGSSGSRVYTSMAVARKLANAVLLAAWTVDQIDELIDQDPSVRSLVLDLAMADGMKGRPEWDVKDGPRETLRKSALADLRLLAEGQLRSSAESTAGRNPHLSGGRVSTQRTPNKHLFAPSRSNPNPRGF